MTASSRWLLPPVEARLVETLVTALRLKPPAARVLVSRGFADPEAARRFLAPALEQLHDPYLLTGMHAAIERVRRAIGQREKILLYGDYDVDGTTSVVILKKVIELAGGCADFHVPHRLRDGYGMRMDVIERARENGFSLVISVDTGIRASDVVRNARDLGIDMIITDHHLPEAELPPALAVLNPNRRDCAYPEKNLCGAGVAFKLAQALIATLEWAADRKRRMVESFLKLAAIATVADVVPLTGENRIIVKLGLAGLHTVRNAGLRALMEVAGFTHGQCPSAQQVAFRIAPRINAAGRMATAQDAVELFLTNDEDRARELAAQLHLLNQERQQTEADMVRAILEQCEQTPVTLDQAALVFAGKGWHRGVVGIVASRLVDRFHRPVFVLSDSTEEGEVQGSGRSIRAFHLLEALEAMPGLFSRFGGHRQAAGLSLPEGRVDEFRNRLNTYASARLIPDDFHGEIDIDAPIQLHEITEESVEQVCSLAPFGCGNPAPRFVATDIEIGGPPRVFAEKHLNVPLRQNGRMLTAKAWHFAERVAEMVPGRRIDAVLSLKDDPYSRDRGYPGWCVEIEEVRDAAALCAVARVAL